MPYDEFLLSILSDEAPEVKAPAKRSAEEIEEEFKGKGYGDFKMAVGEAVVEELRPIRESYEAIIKDKASLEALYREGAEKAEKVARKTYFKAMKKVGFVL